MRKAITAAATALTSSLLLLNLGSLAAHAYTTSYVDNKLTVNADVGESVTVACSGNDLQINGVTVSGGEEQCNVVEWVVVNGNTGNESLKVLTSGMSSLLVIQGFGNGGNDSIDLQTSIFTVADGGQGNDIVVTRGQLGFAGLNGGTGNDWVLIDATPNADTISVSAGNTVTMNGNNVTPANFEIRIIGGNAGNDTMTINSPNWWAIGGPDNDTITSSAGATINGDAGDDTLIQQMSATVNGGDDNDTITLQAGGIANGEGGNDTFYMLAGGFVAGGPGDDNADATLGGTITQFHGNGGFDTFDFFATNGPDQVKCLSGNPCTINGISFDMQNVDQATLDFGEGNDIDTSPSFRGFILSSPAVVNLGGGNDNMRIVGAVAANGGEGNDVISGSSGNDTFNGGPGSDTLDFGYLGCTGYYCEKGTAGNDVAVIDGTDNNDSMTFNTFTPGPANGTPGACGTNPGVFCYVQDRYQGSITSGADTDTLQWASTAILNAGGGGDIINTTAVPFGVELHGGTGADTISGGSSNDTLFGEEGDDALVGNGGDDTLNPGDGAADVVLGNAGTDTVAIVGSSSANAITVGSGTVTSAGNEVTVQGSVELGTIDVAEDNDVVEFLSTYSMPWTVDGNLGSDTLIVHTAGATYVDDGSNITVTGRPTIAYLNFEIKSIVF